MNMCVLTASFIIFNEGLMCVLSRCVCECLSVRINSKLYGTFRDLMYIFVVSVSLLAKNISLYS